MLREEDHDRDGHELAEEGEVKDALERGDLLRSSNLPCFLKKMFVAAFKKVGTSANMHFHTSSSVTLSHGVPVLEDS